MFKIYGITVKIQRSCGEQGTKLTFLPYVVKALVSALKNTQDLTLHSMKKWRNCTQTLLEYWYCPILTEAY